MFFHIITEYETEFNTLCGIRGRETGHLAGGVISCRGADAAPLKMSGSCGFSRHGVLRGERKRAVTEL